MIKHVAPIDSHWDALLRALAQFGVVLNGGDPPGCKGTAPVVFAALGALFRALAQFGVVLNRGDPPGCKGAGPDVVGPGGVMMTQ